MPANRFVPLGTPVAHAMEPFDPLGTAQPVGNLLELHEQAEIQLRVLPNLRPFRDAVTVSTLGFSGIRLKYAALGPMSAARRPGERGPSAVGPDQVRRGR